MAYYKGMCEKCICSSSTFPFRYGWCNKYKRPINKVHYKNEECITIIQNNILENLQHINLYKNL